MKVLISDLIKAIRKHHDQFQMTGLFSSQLDVFNPAGVDKLWVEAGGCGTAACFAGWTLHLASENRTLDETHQQVSFRSSVMREAAELLEVHAPGGNMEKHPLFHVRNWPAQFKARWYAAEQSNSEEQASIAIDRLRHFLQHNE